MTLETRRRAVSGPIQVSAPGGLRMDAGCSKDRSASSERLRGWRGLNRAGAIRRYPVGVVPHAKLAPLASGGLARQAVVARTWPCANRHRFAHDGLPPLAADTQCRSIADPARPRCRGVGPFRPPRASTQHLGNEPDFPAGVSRHPMAGISLGFEEVWYAARPAPYCSPSDGPKRLCQRFAVPLPGDPAAGLGWQGGSAYGAVPPRVRWHEGSLRPPRLAKDLGLAAGEPSIGHPPAVRSWSGASGAGGGTGRRGQRRGERFCGFEGDPSHLRQLPSTLFDWFLDGARCCYSSEAASAHGAGLSQGWSHRSGGTGWRLTRILEPLLTRARI